MLVSSDQYHVSSGLLTLELEMDRPLNYAEREAFEHITTACLQYASAAATASLAGAIDVAIGELGGELNICAG